MKQCCFWHSVSQALHWKQGHKDECLMFSRSDHIRGSFLMSDGAWWASRPSNRMKHLRRISQNLLTWGKRNLATDRQNSKLWVRTDCSSHCRTESRTRFRFVHNSRKHLLSSLQIQSRALWCHKGQLAIEQLELDITHPVLICHYNSRTRLRCCTLWYWRLWSKSNRFIKNKSLEPFTNAWNNHL